MHYYICLAPSDTINYSEIMIISTIIFYQCIDRLAAYQEYMIYPLLIKNVLPDDSAHAILKSYILLKLTY